MGVSGITAMRAGAQLSRAAAEVVSKLAQTDRAVRAHESAHLAAAGGYATGGASFSYATGPDGKQYAIAGEVSIDTSPERDPEKTIAKARAIIAAAYAPSDPSSQDRAVAGAAAQMEAQAQTELEVKRRSEALGAYSQNGAPPQSGSTISVSF